REDVSAVAAPEPPPQKAPPAPGRTPVAEPPRVVPAAAVPDPEHARAEASYRQASAQGADADQGGLDFVGLLLSLGTQASMMLGAPTRPGERPGPADLPAARSVISLLEILRDKTEGRRTAEEDEVLEGLLYELRMQYVALARKGGP
ncbi:MAG TPA: DUF1844 domain-containing protein, partial [Vicinamibacteria bacterium]|nr:DUF1844 domain-containing protein [Vicinamibacteria bacterium]